MASNKTANRAAISFSVCMYFSMKNVKICSLGYFKYIKSFTRLTALFEEVCSPKMLLRFSLEDRRSHFENHWYRTKSRIWEEPESLAAPNNEVEIGNYWFSRLPGFHPRRCKNNNKKLMIFQIG